MTTHFYALGENESRWRFTTISTTRIRDVVEKTNFPIYPTYILYCSIFLSPCISFADIVSNSDYVIERLVDIEQKGKVVLINTKKGVGWYGCTAPLIITLGTKWN